MKRLLILLLIIPFFISCVTTRSHDMKYKGAITPGKWLKDISVKVSDGKETSIAMIQIYFPKNYKRGENTRTIIALPSYNSNERDWERNTSIEYLADKYNMAIVCPNMKKSLYESKYYPDTTYRWNVIPGGKFIGEDLLNFVNKNFSLGYDSSKTAIMGVTVGAHGAILVASKYKAFSAAAGISGYYDPTIMTNSRMVQSVYGKYNDNRTIWENDDNNLKLAEGLSGVKVYLFHGSKNDAFTPGQSRIMAIKLKHLQKKSSSYSITYKESKSGYYGWTYWKRQIPEVMEFFDRNLAK